MKRAEIKLFCANAILGVSYTVIVALLEHKIEPTEIFVATLLSGAAIFAPFTPLRNTLRRLTPQDIARIITASLLILFGWALLTLIGSQETSPTSIAAISTLGPAVTLLAIAIDPRRPSTLVRPIAVLIAIISLISLNVESDFNPISKLGDTVVALGVVAFALSTLLLRKTGRKIAPHQLLGAIYIVALTLAAIALPSSFIGLFSLDLTSSIIVDLILLTTVGITLPLYLILDGSRSVTPLRAALYRFVQPVVALIILVIKYHCSNRPFVGEIKDLALTLTITIAILIIATKWQEAN